MKSRNWLVATLMILIAVGITIQAQQPYATPATLPPVQASNYTGMYDKGSIAVNNDMKDMVTELKGLRLQFQQFQYEFRVAHGLKTADAAVTFDQLIKQHCSGCHTAAQAPKQGNLILFDKSGEVIPLTKPQQLEIVKAVKNGDMPPGDRPKVSEAHKPIIYDGQK